MKVKNLTKEPPRSPRVRIRDYAILARAIDKCRAKQAGHLGEYHYNCPVDNALFAFKGVTGEELEHVVKRGMTDEQLGIWLDEHGLAKTPEEIQGWSNMMDHFSLYTSPERRDYFIAECEKLGLDPAQTTLFEWLEMDDEKSFA